MNETTTEAGVTTPAVEPGPRTPFDDARSLLLAVYLTLIGYGVMVGIPVISTAWVELLGFTEAQVGRVAGADLGGLALGSLLASLVMARWDRRWLALAGIVIAVVANGLCMKLVAYEQVLWLRVLAGVGSGVVTAVAVTTLGGSSKPARAYNIMLFAFAFSQAAEMQFLPMLPMNGIYGAFIVAFLLPVPLLRWIPAHPDAVPAGERSVIRDDAAPEPPAVLPWLCLAAIFFTYVNIGTYWTYIELASLDAGIDENWVGRLLVIVSLGSFLGCLVATLISDRFGLARPLLATLAVMASIVGILVPGIEYPNLLLSLALFNFLWIFIDVYQMGTVAVIDRRGVFAALMPGAQGLGQIVGPNLAATVLEQGQGYGAIFAFCAASALVAMLIYGLMLARVQRSVPELAARQKPAA
jgi:predicted MFS family arabinose efflux permease